MRKERERGGEEGEERWSRKRKGGGRDGEGEGGMKREEEKGESGGGEGGAGWESGRLRNEHVLGGNKVRRRAR